MGGGRLAPNLCGAQWVAAIKGEVIGLLRSTRDREEPWICDLKSIWVAPFFRKCGVFRSMLAHVTDYEGVRGAHLLRLWVLERNPEAQQVYNQRGFAPSGDPQPPPGTTYRERRMSRPLTG
jgi:GNAT superfamily N-acetyltransferase